MRIQLFGGPRDGQEFDLGEALPAPRHIRVQLCVAEDFVGSPVHSDVPVDLIGQTAIYRDAGCGVHYVHAPMRGHVHA